MSSFRSRGRRKGSSLREWYLGPRELTRSQAREHGPEAGTSRVKLGKEDDTKS